MNGFLLATEGCDIQVADLARVAPRSRDVTAELNPVDKGRLLTWGTGRGDIHIARRGITSSLVLSGYVAEIKDVSPPHVPQQLVIERLLSLLDDISTDEEIIDLSRRLIGSFGICYRDTARRRFLCVSDRVTSRPLWTCRSGSGWLVSSHPMAIALSLGSVQLDPIALGSFLLYGGPITPTRSLFAGVSALPSGTICHLTDDGATPSRRWYQFQHSPDHLRSVKDWVELASERLTQAATRLVSPNETSAVFFSGGVDSRLTAAALKAAGADPLLVTICDGENIEVRVARAAAKALKLRHKVLLRDPEWYFRGFPSAVYESGGNYVFTHGHFSAAATEVRQSCDTNAFFLGDFCEAFSKIFCSRSTQSGQAWTSQEFSDAFDSIRLPLYRPEDRYATLSLLNAEARSEIEAGLREETSLRHGHVSSVSPDPYIIGDHCFRWESAPTLPTFYMFVDLRAVAAERNIMFDPGVHALLESLPSSVRRDTGLGAKLIKRMIPKAAWVPNANSLLPICWPPQAHALTRKLKPYLGRLRRRLVSNNYRTTGSWPKHSALYLTQPAFRRLFEETLQSSDLFCNELFDPNAIRNTWRAFVNGDERRAADVEKLAQLGQMSILIKEGTPTFWRQGK